MFFVIHVRFGDAVAVPACHTGAPVAFDELFLLPVDVADVAERIVSQFVFLPGCGYSLRAVQPLMTGQAGMVLAIKLRKRLGMRDSDRAVARLSHEVAMTP